MGLYNFNLQKFKTNDVIFNDSYMKSKTKSLADILWNLTCHLRWYSDTGESVST